MPQVIDVDEAILIDLTADPPSIDLTGDSDVEIDLSHDVSPRLIPRTKVLASPIPVGPPSSLRPEIANRIMQKRSLTHEPHQYERTPKKSKQEPASSTPPANPNQTSRTIKRSCTPQQNNLKRSIVLELDSDGEVTGPTTKKIKRETSPESDPETQYACIHAGYDLYDPQIWKPAKINEDKLEYEILDGFQNLTVSSSSHPLPKPRRMDISDRIQIKRPVKHPGFVWEALQASTDIRRPRKLTRPPLPVSVYSERQNITSQLQRVASFKKAPGSINRIVQAGPLVAISSASIGGQPDEPGEEENPYNREGSLMVWDSTVRILPGHRSKLDDYVKHYTVNDVRWDPRSTSLVSSGNDKTVRVWRRGSNQNTFSISRSWKYPHVPHELAFKPGESILAVAERKIHIYSNISSGASEVVLYLGGRQVNHSVGAMIWGRETTSHHLFASSEPIGDTDFNGIHKSFDVHESKMLYQFDSTEAGDALGLTQDGSTLALLTRGENRRHILRLYDTRRQEPHAMRMVGLAPFPLKIEGEVNSATFSPDGIYLALSRNDNHTQVYDSRKLDKILFDYEHYGPCRINPGRESYGVVQAQWVDRETRHLPTGLITGGHDGCVRLWNPRRSLQDSTNGLVIAEMNSDIGSFSIGDCFSGERDLVVGDCAGVVSAFEARNFVKHGH